MRMQARQWIPRLSHSRMMFSYAFCFFEMGFLAALPFLRFFEHFDLAELAELKPFEPAMH